MSRDTRKNPIEWFGYHVCSFFERVMPNPFLFAILLSFVAFLWGLFGPVLDPVALLRKVGEGSLTPVQGIWQFGAGTATMLDHWWNGFWTFLTFSMQMVLILITGSVIAYHPRVRALLTRIASIPENTRSAVVLVAFVAMVCSWVHWGLGLITGAILAREVGRIGEETDASIHYPVVAAAGYSGLGMIWHWGLSASAPLLSAMKEDQGNPFFSDVGRAIPITETILSPYALILSGLSVLVTCAIYYFMAPKDSDEIRPFRSFASEQPAENEENKQRFGENSTGISMNDTPQTIAEQMNQSWIVGLLLSVMGAGGCVMMLNDVIDSGGQVTPNHINFFFLFLGIFLYLRPAQYMKAFYNSVDASAGIILQFPFYAGIMGMINGSGLSHQIAETMVSWSSATTLPVVAWLTGGVLNIFVPSGGGEWMVMGESMIQAAQNLDVPIGKIILCYGAGDQWTNLFQPFWAIPLLGICQVRARDVFGYTFTLLLLSAVFYGLTLTFIPYSTF